MSHSGRGRKRPGMAGRRACLAGTRSRDRERGASNGLHMPRFRVNGKGKQKQHLQNQRSKGNRPRIKISSQESGRGRVGR